MTLRRAGPGDVAECVAIRGLTRENAVSATRLAELGITVQSWAADVAADRLPGFVWATPAQLAGYCFGDAASGEVVVLALRPAFEGQGLGKALLAATMAELRGRGHPQLTLGCAADPAVRSYGFYRHLGWRPTGERDRYGDEVLTHP